MDQESPNSFKTYYSPIDGFPLQSLALENTNWLSSVLEDNFSTDELKPGYLRTHSESSSCSNESSTPSTSSEPTMTRTPSTTSTNSSTAKRKHVCSFAGCGKAFTTSGHLARHNRIHTGERNHHCLLPTCSARFSRQDNMLQHYRTHLSGKGRRRGSISKGSQESSSKLDLPPRPPSPLAITPSLSSYSHIPFLDPSLFGTLQDPAYSIDPTPIPFAYDSLTNTYLNLNGHFLYQPSQGNFNGEVHEA